MERITLPSGSVLEINLLPFGEARALNQRLAKVISKLNLNLKSVNFADLMTTDVLALSGPICELLSSQEIIDAAEGCFKRCLIDNLKIDEKTFEESSKRQDYFPAIFSVLKANISPFFIGLPLFLKAK